MSKRMDDQPTFDLSGQGAAQAWHAMNQYLAGSRIEPEPTPDILEEDHQRIIDLINAADRSVMITEVAADLSLDPGKLKPVLRSLASEGHFTQLVHRFVSNDVYNGWTEEEQFSRQYEN